MMNGQLKLKHLILLLSLFCLQCNLKTNWILVSPDGNLKISVQSSPSQDAFLSYHLKYQKTTILDYSPLSIEFADSTLFSSKFKIVDVTSTTADTTWIPLYGEKSKIRDHYNEMTFEIQEQTNSKREIQVTFRAYNMGAAFRYSAPKQKDLTDFTIQSENSFFNFTENHQAYVTYTAQGRYEKIPISEITKACERPLTLKINNGLYVSLFEAGLVDYARMQFMASSQFKFSLKTKLDSEVNGRTPYRTPWRVIMVGEKPGDFIENNSIIYNLNPPGAIPDVSWIKPGKVIREVTLTTQGGLACVDFAAANNLQYVEFDAGWYGHESDDSSDATTVTVDPKRSKGPLDLHRVIEYAEQKDIGILLYVNRRALETQMDEIFPLYKSWGVRGVKFGFVQVGSQEWTTWLHNAVKKAADHKLMVDIHDEYRPTGFSRTFPNLMTQEGIRGDETTPATEQTLITLFTRMIAGAGDNTICYFADRVENEMANHGFQLAKAIAFYSPLQFVFWYDRPAASPRNQGGLENKRIIQDVPELEFFKNLPTTWDETKVLAGEIGELAIIARRKEKTWFVGLLNHRAPRELQIPLSFLNDSTRYISTTFFDDPDVKNSTQIGLKKQSVDKQSILKIVLASNSGQAIRIEPTR